jgi:hypothetical protein
MRNEHDRLPVAHREPHARPERERAILCRQMPLPLTLAPAYTRPFLSRCAMRFMTAPPRGRTALVVLVFFSLVAAPADGRVVARTLAPRAFDVLARLLVQHELRAGAASAGLRNARDRRRHGLRLRARD